MEMHRWGIEKMIKNFFKGIWSVLKAIWVFIIGHPAELTYWWEGAEIKVRVRRFREVKPNHIIFTNEDTKKHVVVKAEHTIKYIIREE